MKIRRLPNTARVVQVYHMEIDGQSFEFDPGPLDELLCSLADADGFGNAVVMYDERVKAIFEKAGLLKTNIRGGCYGTPKLKKHLRELEKALCEELPDASLGPSEPEEAPKDGGLLLDLGDER